jgi:large conductance mechanosensitive channel
LDGFRKFLLRGNVIDLAVAIVIGAAFLAVVQAFVRAFVTPLIGVFGGVPDMSAVSFTINNSRFPVGEFLNALLTFVIIAAVVYYFVVVPAGVMLERFQEEEAKRECPYCLSKIPTAATRCAFLHAGGAVS